jgi:hypothetical protein
MSLSADNQYLFAGTNGSSIWRRPLSQVVTDTEEEINLQPNEFSLEQNYPNPFNPSTTIKFNLSEKEFVNLKVFDLLGKEIAEILNEEKPAGRYEVDFDASSAGGGLSSGVYFYQLKAGNLVQVKKMLLMK